MKCYKKNIKGDERSCSTCRFLSLSAIFKEFKSQNGRITAPEENIPRVILGPLVPDYLKSAKHPLYPALIENCWRAGEYLVKALFNWTVLSAGVLDCSVCMVRVLAVIFSCLHLQNVGNDAVNGDVTYQAGEKELLCNAGVHESQGWQTCQYTGQPGKTNISQRLFTRRRSIHVYTCIILAIYPNTSTIFLLSFRSSGN